MEKINYKDVNIIKGKDAKDYFKVDGGLWNLSEHYVRLGACTHINCQKCNKEVEKHFSMICSERRDTQTIEKYKDLELVEWDGETPLVTYDEEKYFFSEEDIESYCEENDLDPNQLMLVLCEKSKFTRIDFDFWEDDTHEDWEPSKEFEDKLKEFNRFLMDQSTETWFPSKKRVAIIYPKTDI